MKLGSWGYSWMANCAGSLADKRFRYTHLCFLPTRNNFWCLHFSFFPYLLLIHPVSVSTVFTLWVFPPRSNILPWGLYDYSPVDPSSVMKMLMPELLSKSWDLWDFRGIAGLCSKHVAPAAMSFAMMCIFVIISIIIDLCPKSKQQHSFVHSFIHSSAFFFQLASHHFLKLCRWPMALKASSFNCVGKSAYWSLMPQWISPQTLLPKPVFLSLVAKPLAPIGPG